MVRREASPPVATPVAAQWGAPRKRLAAPVTSPCATTTCVVRLAVIPFMLATWLMADLFRASLVELLLVELGIVATLCQQFRVAATFDNLALLHDQNTVCIFNRR